MAVVRFTVGHADSADPAPMPARSVAGDLLRDGELRLKLRAAIAEAEAKDDAKRVAQVVEVLRLADEFGVRWDDKARQVLGLDEES